VISQAFFLHPHTQFASSVSIAVVCVCVCVVSSAFSLQKIQSGRKRCGDLSYNCFHHVSRLQRHEEVAHLLADQAPAAVRSAVPCKHAVRHYHSIMPDANNRKSLQDLLTEGPILDKVLARMPADMQETRERRIRRAFDLSLKKVRAVAWTAATVISSHILPRL